jgi:hypothetical protein
MNRTGLTWDQVPLFFTEEQGKLMSQNGAYKAPLKNGKSYLPSCAAEGIFKSTPTSAVNPTYAAKTATTNAQPEYHPPAATTSASVAPEYKVPSNNGSSYYVSGAETNAANSVSALLASALLMTGALML